MYVSRDVPVVASTWKQGTSKHKLILLVGYSANTTPTPPTCFTELAEANAGKSVCALKQRMTFPFANVAFKEPAKQLLPKW